MTECPEFEVKKKIRNIFVNKKILEEYSVRVYEIDSYFYKHYKEKIQVDKNGRKYILFRIDVYFTEYLLAIEIDEKVHKDRELIFEEERQKALEKRLGCEFIRINMSQHYSGDYEIGRKQTFINKSKDRKLKKLEKE